MSVHEKLQHLVSLLNLDGANVSFDEEKRTINILVDEGEWFKALIPGLIKDLKHLANLMCKRENEAPYVVDVNNYRKERERLIVELAKAAAQKVVMTKAEVRLPPMNSYERRLVHMELSMRPDVKTESIGEGAERSVIVKASDL